MALTRPQPKKGKGAHKGTQKGSTAVVKTQVKREFPQRTAPQAPQPFWQKKPAPKATISKPITTSRPASKGSQKGSSKGSFRPVVKKEFSKPPVRPMVRKTVPVRKSGPTVPVRKSIPSVKFGTQKGSKGQGKGPGRWVRVETLQKMQKKGGFAARVQDRKKQVSKARTVAKDFKFDGDARYIGTVGAYWKHKGYGFIDLEEKGVVPDDKIFVYWKNIKTDDRFPFLRKDMQVEFGLGRKKLGNRSQLFAKQVSLPGDEQVSLQDEADASKEFIGDQSSRYTGHLKFFSPKHGYGYIKTDDGQDIDEKVPKELRVETSEVNSGGRQPKHMKDMDVEFGIWKTKKDKFRAYNMTLPGGLPFSQEQLENRADVADGEEFTGTVKIWCHKFGWGFIQPEKGAAFPEEVKSKIKQMNKATKAKGKKVENEGLLYFRRNDLRQGFRCNQNGKVAFQVYTDDKGAGARDIHEA